MITDDTLLEDALALADYHEYAGHSYKTAVALRKCVARINEMQKMVDLFTEIKRQTGIGQHFYLDENGALCISDGLVKGTVGKLTLVASSAAEL